MDGTTVVGTPILNGFSFVYANTTLGVLDNALLQSSTSVVTATYVDALGTLGVFNFTDICTKVTVLGPAVPCQDLAISFTDVTLGDASIAAAIAANINVGVGVGNISIAGANLANFNLLDVSVAEPAEKLISPILRPPSLSPVPLASWLLVFSVQPEPSAGSSEKHKTRIDQNRNKAEIVGRQNTAVHTFFVAHLSPLTIF